MGIRKKIHEGIREIISLNLNADWEWFHNAIISFCEDHGATVRKEVDTEPLNAMRVDDDTIEEFIDKYLIFKL